jgi:hypothetical protein
MRPLGFNPGMHGSNRVKSLGSCVLMVWDFELSFALCTHRLVEGNGLISRL